MNNKAKEKNLSPYALKNMTGKQRKCTHEKVDGPDSVFGETCVDCGLFLNNGGF